MVVLTSPLMHGGRILPPGTQVQLTPEFEARLIQNGHAQLVGTDAVEVLDDFYPGRAKFMKVANSILGRKGKK